MALGLGEIPEWGRPRPHPPAFLCNLCGEGCPLSMCPPLGLPRGGTGDQHLGQLWGKGSPRQLVGALGGNARQKWKGLLSSYHTLERSF